MKPLLNSIRRQLPPVKLYLDDLEYIVRLLKSVSSEVTIKTQEHEFSNLSELSQIKEKVLRELEIESRSAYISLNLATKSAFYTSQKIFQQTSMSSKKSTVAS